MFRLMCFSVFFMTLCTFPLVSFVEGRQQTTSQGIQMPHPDEEGNIPTFNKYGFFNDDAFLDPFSQDFILYASIQPRKLLEIGAGFGQLSLEALKGGSHVIINDMDSRHLDLTRKNLPPVFRDHAEFKKGYFPSDLSFPPESLDAIFCRVFQFLSGREIKQGLQKMYSWLKPGGRLYVIVPTIYMKGVPNDILQSFQRKRHNKNSWPGEHIPTASIFPRNIAYNFPDTMHLFDMDTVVNALFKASFYIIRISYFDRYHSYTGLQPDGRQSIGVIAEKPPLHS